MDLKNLPLATTPGGTAFCLKALHPSEHTIKSARCPGGNKMSVALCSDGIYDIPIQNANSTLQLCQGPNPVIPACVNVTYLQGSAPVSAGWWNIYNTAFSGSSRSCFEFLPNVLTNLHYVNDFCSRVTEYRITSQSVTVEYNAPALSDQGTITAVQYNAAHSDGSFTVADTGGATVKNQHLMADWTAFGPIVAPTAAVLGTNAYTAKAREGAYQPLKLTSFKWRPATDRTYFFQRSASQMADDDSIIASSYNQVFPFFEDRNGKNTIGDLGSFPKYCGYNFGTIYMQGLSAGSSVRIRVRQVVEVTATPSTVYAPLLEIALPPDMTALKMYSEISARMADAYPASYNDLGKLKDFVLSVGKKVLPYVEPGLDLLSKMPGIPGLIGKGATMIAPIVKNAVAQKAEERKKATSSQSKAAGSGAKK